MFSRQILTSEDDISKKLCKIKEANYFTNEFKELAKQLEPLISSKEEYTKALYDKFKIPSDKLAFYYYEAPLNKWTKKNI
jgi:hypothetical protein